MSYSHNEKGKIEVILWCDLWGQGLFHWVYYHSPRTWKNNGHLKVLYASVKEKKGGKKRGTEVSWLEPEKSKYQRRFFSGLSLQGTTSWGRKEFYRTGESIPGRESWAFDHQQPRRLHTTLFYRGLSTWTWATPRMIKTVIAEGCMSAKYIYSSSVRMSLAD